MPRVYNFSAGPSMLPEEVLKKAAAQMLDYEGCGQSVAEMSHRSKEFGEIIEKTEHLLREIYTIPNDYTVLFLQGGASTQFSAIPLNFMNKNGKADFVITGQWAKKAYKEAQKYGECNVVASSEDKSFSYIPKLNNESFSSDADYFYICLNNTIYGTFYHKLPDTNGVPLIADISSCFLSEPLDITKFAMVYAGAQKNLAPAGLTVCIIRKDMLGNAREITPTMLNYKIMADSGSLYNTPPCYNIYISKLVLEWIKDFGGLEKMQLHNRRKANLLYDFIDESELFKGNVNVEDRSMMNIAFSTGNAELNEKFVNEASANGLINLKGHRSVGGMRASVYNAMSFEGVAKLVEFMAEFEKKNL